MATDESLTAKELMVYLDCPRRHRHQFIDRRLVPLPRPPKLVRDGLVHEALRHIHDDGAMDEGAVLDLVDRVFTDARQKYSLQGEMTAQWNPRTATSEYFCDNRIGEPESLNPEGFARFHRTAFFMTREGIDAAAQAVLGLARKLDFSVEVHGKRLDERRWRLEVKAPMPAEKIVRQIDKILKVGVPAA